MDPVLLQKGDIVKVTRCGGVGESCPRLSPHRYSYTTPLVTTVKVLPNMFCPVDGEVLHGTAEVDEKAVSGD